MDTAVIGLGRPHGDDAAGWLVVERLSALGIPAVRAPDGAAMVDALSSVSRAVIIDAVVGAGPPGTVIHLCGADLDRLPRGAVVSSHGLFLPDALALSRALGGASDVHLIGIAIEPPCSALPALSAAVAAAVPAAAALALSLLEKH